MCGYTKRHKLPEVVEQRAKAVGEAGERWLADLDSLIKKLEEKWGICIGDALEGGTHAFVAHAIGKNAEKYVVKIDIPEGVGGAVLSNSIKALKLADGKGYVKLYDYDMKNRAYLLECLDEPLASMGFTVNEQLKIICDTLKETWKIPIKNTDLPKGDECTKWFKEFIPQIWDELKRPCKKLIITQALKFLDNRDAEYSAEKCVLIHGDAHAWNLLKVPNQKNAYKFVDPDGAIYEKAADLGVLMREWREEYEVDALKSGEARCELLHSLTGVSKKAIWEWGYIQTVSTALVLLSIGRVELGSKMLVTAEEWLG